MSDLQTPVRNVNVSLAHLTNVVSPWASEKSGKALV